MIDWYREYDEINAELREMAKASASEVHQSTEGETGKLYIGSGEDFDTASVRLFAQRMESNGAHFYVFDDHLAGI
jgi:hypothetical protein